MIVLADSSVWIRFLSNRSPYAAAMRELLSRGAVAGHELVAGELLIGDRGGRGVLLASYDLMDRAPTISHAEVVAFVRARALHGRGLGWIDAHLLASALVGRMPLWTADTALGTVAAQLGVAYTP